MTGLLLREESCDFTGVDAGEVDPRPLHPQDLLQHQVVPLCVPLGQADRGVAGDLQSVPELTAAHHGRLPARARHPLEEGRLCRPEIPLQVHHYNQHPTLEMVMCEYSTKGRGKLKEALPFDE